MSVQQVSVAYVSYPEHLVTEKDKRCYYCLGDPNPNKPKEWFVHEHNDSHPIHKKCAIKLFFNGYINCSTCKVLIDPPLKTRVGLFLHKYTDILIMIGGALPVFVGAGIMHWQVIDVDTRVTYMVKCLGVGLIAKKKSEGGNPELAKMLFELKLFGGFLTAIEILTGGVSILPENVTTLFTPIRVAGLVALLSGLILGKAIDENMLRLGQLSGAVVGILSGIVLSQTLFGLFGGIIIGGAGGFLTKKIIDFALKSLSE